MEENKLQVIVKESGLAPAKAQQILTQFQDYFTIAAEWETKAKSLVVTKESQTAEMTMARTGRLFLREKRIAIETARKELKEQSLRESKAIDGIANVLKALIVPIEEYLEHQEKFVEIQEAKKTEAKRLEIEARMAEEERIAAEKAAAEQERIRLENEKLRKEAKEKDEAIAAERKTQEEKMREIVSKAAKEKEKQNKLLAEQEAKAKAERKAVEDKARKEKEEQEKKLAEERAKVEADKKKTEEKARKEKEVAQAKLETERKEKERLAEMLKNQIECPKCHHRFNINK